MKLRDSQQVALEKLCEPGRNYAALWAEPRSGKTAVALLWLRHIRPKVAVVVGPKIAEMTWRTESAKWLKKGYSFYPLTAGNEYPSLNLFSGITILFVNYEQFSRSPFKRLRPYLNKVSDWAGGKGAMLLDESHMIKTPNSITGKNIRPLAYKWNYRLLMTGTPVTNPDQIDAVYGQWTFLNPAIRDKWETARDFRDHFGEWSTLKGFPELVRPIHQAELNKYIQSDVITMTGDANPVPVKRVKYTLPSEVSAYHSVLMKKGVLKLPGHTVIGLNPLTRLLRLRMLVAGWAKDDEGESFTIRPAAQKRLAVLGKVLAKCDGKVIVSCSHLWEVSLVQKKLRRMGLGYLVITGATKNKDNVIEEFQRNPEARVLLVQPRTVAMAVDISVAGDLIWYTSDFNYVTFKQASDRIKLSPASPTVWFLCAKGTVDEDVWVTLRKDHNHLRKLLRKMRGQDLR